MFTNELVLQSIYNKSILWGELDSDLLIKSIRSLLNNNINYIEINLEGIKSLDARYVYSVFVNSSRGAKRSGKSLFYLFTNPDNDEIVSQISNILSSSKIFSLLKTGSEIEVIGEASFLKKFIFKNISENDLVNPIAICKEFDKAAEKCKSEFEEFVHIGFLEKESDEVYKTNLIFTS